MSTKWNSGSQARSGIMETLRRYFADAPEHDAAPRMEQLEGRVFLSANPLSELTDHQASWQYASDQAVHMPLTAGQGLAPTGVESGPVALAAADAVGPVIASITASKEAVRTFDPVYFTIAASAESGIAGYQLTVNGQALGVGATTGRSSGFTVTEAGVYELVATVTDKAGNTATYVTSLEVAESPDVKAPTVYLGVGNNGFYRSDVPLRVTIADADSLEINWTATLIDNATGEERLLGSGDRAV